MSSVFKMEFFRLRKSKYTYLIMLIVFLLFFVGTILDSSQSTASTAVNEENQNNFELYTENYNEDYSAAYSNKCEMLVSSFEGNIVAMSILIFTGLFAGAYHAHRFDKNIIGLIGKRHRLVFVNLIICAIYSLAVICGTIVVSWIGYLLFNQNFAVIPFGNLSVMTGYLITYYILLVCVAALMSCFVYAIRNQILAIVLGLLYGSGIIYEFIDFAGKYLISDTFSIKRYVPLGTLYDLSMYDQAEFVRALVIAVIFGGCALCLSVFIQNRRDVAT